MQRPVIVKGEKVGLSPLMEEDLEKFWQWINNKKVTQFMFSFDQKIGKKEEKEWLSSILEGQENANTFSIIHLEEGRLIGNCTLQQKMRCSAELGIFIGEPGFWGMGLGTEAVQLLLDYGFNVLELHSIWVMVFDYNDRAKQCYENAGFQEVGKLREALYRGHTYHDVYVMDVLRSEFNEKFDSRIKQECDALYGNQK